ncbi:hypothetical protein VM1G_07776 [Cytospora mali]|uniref:DUF6546 domain-containing protein n=1 Tax=Cytospora mali TaxID=578113 RepID=A0A194W650_CYTMA|nr:hypothetical protein VM1G_07776 [Valsa mali]
MATMSSKISWDSLPAEVRLFVFEALIQTDCKLAHLATVSREWQTLIERHNFSRIKLTPSRLVDLDSNIRRNRALLRYIWFCVELEKYDCTSCADLGTDTLTHTDATLVATALQTLFSTLSTWEPVGELLLDISVYSPCDSEHWFKYLTFRPDDPSVECSWSPGVEQTLLEKVGDIQHDWNPVEGISGLMFATNKMFCAIGAEESVLNGDERELQCVPDSAQTLTPVVSEAAAETFLDLEHFSASFIVDASPFFSSYKPSWKCINLKSLTITSRLLTPEALESDVNEMLKAAAVAAKNMPRLETMEIWNGEASLAALFKYQSSGGQMHAAITWRSTWDFALRPPVIQAWEAVAHKYGGRGLTINKELLDIRNDVKSHGDAIYYLKLSQLVVRPVSLQQIRTEHKIYQIWEKRKNDLQDIRRPTPAAPTLAPPSSSTTTNAARRVLAAAQERTIAAGRAAVAGTGTEEASRRAVWAENGAAAALEALCRGFGEF